MAALLLLCGCQVASADPGADHLQHFGFAAIDCQWDDPTDLSHQNNYLRETAFFTNVGQMCVFSPTDPLQERLKAFQDQKVRAILHLEAVLFEQVPDSKMPSKYRLRPWKDVQQRWEQFVQLHEAQLTPDRVAALYIADEPLWNGLGQSELDQAIKRAKDSFPRLPTLVIEAAPTVSALHLSADLDWVGFDQYGLPDPAEDPTFMAGFKGLKQKLRPHQKLVLVADTEWRPSYQTAGLQPADMSEVFRRTAAQAQKEDRVVALLGYVWPSGLDGPEHQGARALPASVQQTYQNFGKRFRY